MTALRHLDLDGSPSAISQPIKRPFDFNRIDFLFPDFTRDKVRYKYAQAYWDVVFDRALDAALVAPELWRRHWRYNPLRDGSAIFTAVCRSRNVAIKVNQHAPTDAAVGFTWAIKPLPAGKLPMSELVVTCVPSRTTMTRVFPLIISWLRGDTLAQEFDAKYDV